MIIPKFIFKQTISSKMIKIIKAREINEIIIFRTQYEREEIAQQNILRISQKNKTIIISQHLIQTKERIIIQENLNNPIKQVEVITKDIFSLEIQSLDLILFYSTSLAEPSLD